MPITTGGITVAAGVLVFAALAVGGVAVLRDDAATPSTEGAECDPQPKSVATRAERAYLSEHLSPDREPPAWFSGVSVTSRDEGNEMVQGAIEAGIPASDPLPASTPDGWLLLVMYDPSAEPPDLPSCFEDTAVLYVGNGPFSGD